MAFYLDWMMVSYSAVCSERMTVVCSEIQREIVSATLKADLWLGYQWAEDKNRKRDIRLV